MLCNMIHISFDKIFTIIIIKDIYKAFVNDEKLKKSIHKLGSSQIL